MIPMPAPQTARERATRTVSTPCPYGELRPYARFAWTATDYLDGIWYHAVSRNYCESAETGERAPILSSTRIYPAPYARRKR